MSASAVNSVVSLRGPRCVLDRGLQLDWTTDSANIKSLIAHQGFTLLDRPYTVTHLEAFL